MTSKRTYKTVSVQQLDAGKIAEATGQACVVAIDVAKTKMVVGFGTGDGQCIQIARFEHPRQTQLFLKFLHMLGELGVEMSVVMEPTGVYGDSLRHQLSMMGLHVFRMDAKKVHDAAELLDGVPSLHDAKACTLLIHLHAQGLSRAWRERGELESAMRSLVDEREIFSCPFQRCFGQLEAIVARHWPELCEELDFQRSWHLHLLSEFGSAANVAAHQERAAALLKRTTHGKLSADRIKHIMELSICSLGVPMSEHEQNRVHALTQNMLDLRVKFRKVERRIEVELSKHEALHKLVETFGAVTTAVVLADVGNPAAFTCTGAFEKALGLNLKIRSSGNHTGEKSLHITKRGAPRVRRYLFLAALRFIASDELTKRWYMSRTSFHSGIKLKAVIAVMRKLARAMVHVARGKDFDATKLFDVRRLMAPHSHNASSASSAAQSLAASSGRASLS